jgi:hypothetical protein
MITVIELVNAALYELDAIPGDLAELEVVIDDNPNARTIRVEAAWAGEYVPARFDGPLAGPAEWEHVEGDDATTWDGVSDPAEIIADTFGFIDADVWQDQEPSATIYLPAAAVDVLLAEYLGQGPDDSLVSLFDPASFPRNRVSDMDYREWADAMHKVVASEPPKGRRIGGFNSPRLAPPVNATFSAGMWAGVELGKAIGAAARLDDKLQALGHEPLFLWMTVPRVFTVDTVHPGFAAKIGSAYAAAGKLADAWRSTTD